MHYIEYNQATMSSNSETLLMKYFKFNDFRVEQKPIVDSLLAGRDVFALMQTGGGKSLCFQVPAVGKEGITIVVCPLIALMNDQVRALKYKNIKAKCLHSGIDVNEQNRIERDAISGKLKLLYVAPERIITERFHNILIQMDIAMFVFDEGHVISEWGEGFRPAYRLCMDAIADIENDIAKLKRLKNYRIQKAVFSASVIEQARGDIIKQTRLYHPQIFISSFARTNIQLNVINDLGQRTDKFTLLRNFLKAAGNSSSIIYAGTRKETEDLAGRLQVRGIKAKPYHAGLPKNIRHQSMTSFMKNEDNVMVCTSAFGMGIDKKDVRHVFHWKIPPTLEDLYQEMGRAGRDGLPAKHIAFYHAGDLNYLQDQIDVNYPPAISVKKFNAFVVAYLTTQGHDVLPNEANFISDMIGSDVTDRMVPALINHAIRAGLLTTINEAHNPNAHTDSTKRLMTVLVNANAVFDYMSIEKQRNAAIKKLVLLKDYLASTTCRTIPLLDYLGEHDKAYTKRKCGHCDNCLGSTVNVTKRAPSPKATPPNDTKKPPALNIPGAKITNAGRSATIKTPSPDPKANLQAALKTLRLNIARKVQVPAQQILSDNQISIISARRPDTLESLILDAKLTPQQSKAIGTSILKIVRYCKP